MAELQGQALTDMQSRGRKFESSGWQDLDRWLSSLYATLTSYKASKSGESFLGTLKLIIKATKNAIITH